MKYKTAYTSLVKSLVDGDILIGEEKKGVAGVPLPTPKIVSGLGNRWVHSLLYADFAVKCVKSDSEKKSETEKYYQLLALSFRSNVNFYEQKKQRSMTDLDFLDNLNSTIKTNVEENDRLFTLLYVMSENVLSEEERSSLWNKVVNGELSTYEASEQMKYAAYKAFTKTDNIEVKKGCARIIVAFQENLTDYNEVNKKCRFDENGESPLFDALYYIGRSFDNSSYVGYGKTLASLDSEERKKQLSQYMGGMYHALALEGNKLYLDNSESEETKAKCHQLMTKLNEFGVEYSQVTKDMEISGYRTKADIPKSETTLLKRVNALEKKGNEINATINQLSVDTSSKRWGVIALFSAIILALGAVTLGVGWGLGLSKMVSSIRSDSQFFKINKEHHDVVKKAREIMKVTDPKKINLMLLEDFQEVEYVEAPAPAVPSARSSSQD